MNQGLSSSQYVHDFEINNAQFHAKNSLTIGIRNTKENSG
jgi:hypothetical protein